jgi:hypothetical protein
MARWWLITLCIWGAVSIARADGLKLDWPSQSWFLGTGYTKDFVIAIENPTGISDPLCGWQASLTITPDIGATGTVQFRALSLPTNYVFAGQPDDYWDGEFHPPSNATGMVADNIGLPGVVVPVSGTSLLDVQLTASTTASGRFKIAFVAGALDDTSWFSSDFLSRSFDGVPLNSGSVDVGWVDVTPSPEPGTALLLVSAGILLLGVWRVRCRCQNLR